MASASGCIALSLALHAGLLWKVSTPSRAWVQRRVAIELMATPLSRAALDAVARASPFPPLPAALGRHLTLDVPVLFELSD